MRKWKTDKQNRIRFFGESDICHIRFLHFALQIPACHLYNVTIR